MYGGEGAVGLGGIGDEGGRAERGMLGQFILPVFSLPLSLICMAGGGELLSSGEPP